VTDNPEAGNPTELIMGTVAEADTSHVDGVIESVAEEHNDSPEPVSVADQQVEDDKDKPKDEAPVE